MNSQTYRTVFINLLIQLALFGDDFSKLMNYEIISKSKNMTIIHIAAQNRRNIHPCRLMCGQFYYQ